MAVAKQPLRWHEKVSAELGLRGWSVAKLARAMGMKDGNEAQLRRWLSGEVRPRADVIPKIAKALGWTTDALLSQVYAPEERIPDEEIARLLRSLPPEAVKIIRLLDDPRARQFLSRAADQYLELTRPQRA